MKALLSDSGRYIVVYDETEGAEEPVQYSIDEFADMYGFESLPEREEKKEINDEHLELLILEYVAEFCNLIDICGKISYHMSMIRCVKENITKAKNVAAAYQHDLGYYREQYNSWREKALRSWNVFRQKGAELGYEMPNNKKDFLNNLVFYKDRRRCYKDHLERWLKKGRTFSPKELEEKYLKMLKKRQGKK